MKVRPALRIGLGVWLIYCAIIFGTWAAVGADYSDLAGYEVIGERLLLPAALGAILLIAVVARLGWWQPIMREENRGGPRWAMWVFLPFIIFFVALLLATTDWPAIAASHLLLLVLASLLVGFNEEILTRGVLVVACRGSTKHEVWVWLFSTGLFGLMHIPNGFFGIGLSGGISQAVLTFLLGSGLYLLRRVGGTIILPILAHALWDFSVFAHQVPGDGIPLLATLIQFLTYFAALVLVAVVLSQDHKVRSEVAK